jgi:hypothetical protein
MPPDIVAFAIAFVIGVFAGVQIEKANTRERRAKWQRKKQRGEVPQLQPKHDAVPKVPDAADQLRTVMKAEFKPQRLLNRSEARLFKAIDRQVLEARPGWQVMAQVTPGS